MGKRNYKKFYAGAIGAVWGAQRAIEEVPMTVKERELLSIMVEELLWLADFFFNDTATTEIYKEEA